MKTGIGKTHKATLNNRQRVRMKNHPDDISFTDNISQHFQLTEMRWGCFSLSLCEPMAGMCSINDGVAVPFAGMYNHANGEISIKRDWSTIHEAQLLENSGIGIDRTITLSSHTIDAITSGGRFISASFTDQTLSQCDFTHVEWVQIPDNQFALSGNCQIGKTNLAFLGFIDLNTGLFTFNRDWRTFAS